MEAPRPPRLRPRPAFRRLLLTLDGTWALLRPRQQDHLLLPHLPRCRVGQVGCLGLLREGLSFLFCIVIFIVSNLNLMTCTVVFPLPEEQDPGAASPLGVGVGSRGSQLAPPQPPGPEGLA